MSRLRYRWREVRPDPIRTAAASTATVRHAEQIIEGQAGPLRSVCGFLPKRGWQATTDALPPCERCAAYIKLYSYTEVK